MNKIKAVLMELRAPFITVTIIPVIIGTAAAYREGLKFDPGYFFLVMAAFIFLHLGTNVLNDYFDDVNGTDKVNNSFIPPFTGGSRLIQSGVLKPVEVLVQGAVLFILGSACFLPLIMKFGIPMVCVLVFALIAGIFYTAPPFKWAHLGLGEFLIFISFGPLMGYAAYAAQGGLNPIIPVVASLAVGFLASAIVDINEFPDFNADKETGKRNLVVRLGAEKGRITYVVIVGMAYISIVAAVIMKALPVFALLAMLTIPLAVKAAEILYKNFNNPEKLAPACGMTILNHLLTGVVVIAVMYFA